METWAASAVSSVPAVSAVAAAVATTATAATATATATAISVSSSLLTQSSSVLLSSPSRTSSSTLLSLVELKKNKKNSQYVHLTESSDVKLIEKYAFGKTANIVLCTEPRFSH